ncbi:MAG: fibronectin type III domain-containing protein, partial [Planctomycetes bacterium]|nr:fibronectin type III domain-containing protein [Planctomycetota bacterium]
DAALPPVLSVADSSPNSIEVQSSTSDPSSGFSYTSYYFQRADNQVFDVNVVPTSWQSSEAAEFSDLDPNTEYWFRVRAIDENSKTTGWSETISETINTDDSPPTPNPSQWAVEPYCSGNIHSMTAVEASDETGPVWYYFECMSSAGLDSGWQLSETYTYNTGYEMDCSYRVKTRDSVAPTPNTGVWSEAVSTNSY